MFWVIVGRELVINDVVISMVPKLHRFCEKPIIIYN